MRHRQPGKNVSATKHPRSRSPESTRHQLNRSSILRVIFFANITIIPRSSVIGNREFQRFVFSPKPRVRQQWEYFVL